MTVVHQVCECDVGWMERWGVRSMSARLPHPALTSTLVGCSPLNLVSSPHRLRMNEPTHIHPPHPSHTHHAPLQPRYSIFRAFDDVLLLGKGGRQVYLGPSRLALPYFESLGFTLPPNENPAGAGASGWQYGLGWRGVRGRHGSRSV